MFGPLFEVASIAQIVACRVVVRNRRGLAALITGASDIAGAADWHGAQHLMAFGRALCRVSVSRVAPALRSLVCHTSESYVGARWTQGPEEVLLRLVGVGLTFGSCCALSLLTLVLSALFLLLFICAGGDRV